MYLVGYLCVNEIRCESLITKNIELIRLLYILKCLA